MAGKKPETPNREADFSQTPPTDNDKANWDVEKEARNHGINPAPNLSPGAGQGGN